MFLDRADGGHLIVNPPRDVWEQSELANVEFTHWCILVGAIGRAMIDVLPQLEGGCVNYFEAGNWALNDAAPPKGPKSGARSTGGYTCTSSAAARSEASVVALGRGAAAAGL